MKTKKMRFVSILLGLVMALCLIPGLAIAEGLDFGVADGGLQTAASKPSQTIQVGGMSVFKSDTGKNLNAKVVEGNGTLSYAVTSGGDCIDVGTDGVLTLRKAGTATVTVTAAETDTYAETSVDVPVKVYDTYQYEISFWTVQYAAGNRVFNLASLDLKLFDKSGHVVGSKTVENPQRGNKVTMLATNYVDRVEMTAHIKLPNSNPFTLTGSGGVGGAINVWNGSSYMGRVFTCNYGMNPPDPEYTPPVAKTNLTANGSNQILVHKGSVSVGGTIQYCFGTESQPNNDWGALGWVTAKNPGTYYVWWRIHNTDYYTARYIGQGRSETSPQCIKVTIGKGTISPTVNIDGWTYGETPKTPTVTGNTGNGAVTYEYKAKDAADSTYTTTVPTDAGTYTVRATIADTTSFMGGVATKDFTIAKATVPAQDVRVVGLAFTSDADSAWVVSIEQPLADMLPSDAGTLTYEAGDPEYANGATTLPDDVTSFTSHVDPDGKVRATLMVPLTAIDVPEGVQEITLPVTVKSEKNYEDSTINVVVIPTKREEQAVTIADVPESKTYGDDAFTLTATVKDMTTGDEVSTQNGDWYWYSSNPDVLAVEAENGSNQMQVHVRGAGSAQILAWYEPIGGTTIGAALTDSITVEKAPINPDISIDDSTDDEAALQPNADISIDGWTYGEVAKTPAIIGNAGNGTVTYSYNGTTFGGTAVGPSPDVPTQAGTYTVTATVAETDNYLGATCTKEFIIAPKSVPVTVIAEDKTYDGTTSVNVIAAMKASDLVDGDLIEGVTVYEDGMVTFPGVKGSVADANAGQNKPITLDISGVTYPVEETSNYEARLLNDPTASILPRPVYVQADDKTSQYGESIAALTYRLDDPNDLVGNDTLESLGISASTDATSSSDVGEYPITLTGGTDNTNYDVYFIEGSTYTITQANNGAKKTDEKPTDNSGSDNSGAGNSGAGNSTEPTNPTPTAGNSGAGTSGASVSTKPANLTPTAVTATRTALPVTGDSTRALPGLLAGMALCGMGMLFAAIRLRAVR